MFRRWGLEGGSCIIEGDIGTPVSPCLSVSASWLPCVEQPPPRVLLPWFTMLPQAQNNGPKLSWAETMSQNKPFLISWLSWYLVTVTESWQHTALWKFQLRPEYYALFLHSRLCVCKCRHLYLERTSPVITLAKGGPSVRRDKCDQGPFCQARLELNPYRTENPGSHWGG
jgi:hypothetical protein